MATTALTRLLLVACAAVLAGACRGQDESCVSLFQHGVQAHSASGPLAADAAAPARGAAGAALNGSLPVGAPATGKVQLAQVQAVAKKDAPFNVNFNVASDVPNDASSWGRNDAGASERISNVWTDDVFVNKRQSAANTGDEGLNFFKAAPLVDWMVLIGVVVVAFIFDYLVLKAKEDSLRNHLIGIAYWIAVAIGYCIYIGLRSGTQHGVEWASGYILEWMLSVDNLFVFHLIFQSYKTPSAQVPKAVAVGIFGAVGMRLLFFMVVSTLLQVFSWVRYPFGALLVYSGIEAARSEDDDDDDVEDTRMVRMLRWCMGSRLAKGYDEVQHRMFMYDVNGRFQFTMLFAVVMILECSDLVFALDSVSAKVAQIPQQYIAFSSSVLAMCGLRAAFFVVKDLVEMFDLLKYGICIILIFIGLELILSRWLELPSSVVCVVLVAVFVLSIVASYAKKADLQKVLLGGGSDGQKEGDSEAQKEGDSDGKKDVDTDGRKEDAPAQEERKGDLHLSNESARKLINNEVS